MKTWQEKIPGGFAAMTAPFALHPNDKKRAFAMLGSMIEERVTWPEAETAIRDYLTERNVIHGELNKQMKRVEEKLKPWLP